MLEDKLPECQIGGWITVAGAALQGEVPCTRSVL